MDEPCEVRVYDAPEGEAPSEDYIVWVEGREAFVYSARVSRVPLNQIWPGYQRPLDQTEIASFASWDMAGPVTVEVRSTKPVESVAVRPSSYGIRPEVNGATIRFRMPRPMQVTVEVNGTHHALHLFANPMEQGAPDASDPAVRYFGPGLHNVGVMEVDSGQMVYLAGGAVVHGAIRAVDASGIRIMGRGILDSSTIKRGEAHGAISLSGCSDLRIEGITIRDPNVWTIVPAACERVSISNVKLIGLWRYNADGIDVVNSTDVTIERCFIRAFDDCVVIKGLKKRGGYPTGHLPVRNVRVTGCVLWNDWGRALEIGAETFAPEIADIVFRDCDIVRTTHIALDIQHGDRADIHDVTFEDIRLEIDEFNPRERIQKERDEKFEDVDDDGTYCPRLLVLGIKGTRYSKDSERGTTRNVLVKNVEVTGGRHPVSQISGYDEDHRTEEVTIENLRINGRPIANPAAGRFEIGEHARGVQFVVDGEVTWPGS